jgi:hypothetical protein
MKSKREEQPLYDVFICHASEDKDAVVRELADLLRQKHIEVWYDEFTLQIGDSIRRAIDKGLRRSRFGIVVLSMAFFQKEWPQYELDGLLEKEMTGHDKFILPVWHGISHSYVMKYSPSLAGRLAANTSVGLAGVADQLSQVIKPQSSPLLIARDYLINWGVSPPVITHKHWLSVVEASNNELPFGPVPDPGSIWGRWSFPLPPRSEDPMAWGERLAWAYMQMQWVQEAEAVPITPLTPYREVLEFIHRNSGLYETCQAYPSLLVEWAPQLTIPGFEGDLLETIETAYQASCNRLKETAKRTPDFGTGLTVDHASPRCDDEFALRHPDLGGYDPVNVASAYFHGGMFGPDVSPYSEADHLFWLLSGSSEWLPDTARTCLLDGIANWRGWLWGHVGSDAGGEWLNCGALAEAIHHAVDRRRFAFSKASDADLESRIALSTRRLHLQESVESLKERFLEYRIVEKTISAERTIRGRRGAKKKRREVRRRGG